MAAEWVVRSEILKVLKERLIDLLMDRNLM